MKDTLYADGIAAIQIQNGIAKLVLGSQETPKEGASKDEAPRMLPSKTVAMPLNAFIYALAVFINDERNQEMIAKMQEAAGIREGKE